MNKFRVGGMFICLLSLILAALFIWGISIGEPWRFWAVAVPVIVGFLGALALGFWIGWVMAATEAKAPTSQPKEESPSTTSSTIP